MKKLMIALVAMLIGLGAQAATVSWGVSSVKLPGADGAYGSTSAGTAVTMSIYLTDADTFAAATDAAGVLAAVEGKTADYSGATSMSSKTLTSGDTYNAGDNVYAFVVLSYKDGSGNEWAVGNKAQATIAESMGVAQNASISGLNTYWGGAGNAVAFEGSGSTISGFTAVPEPTSGLLMLVGLGALALRRRRA